MIIISNNIQSYINKQNVVIKKIKKVKSFINSLFYELVLRCLIYPKNYIVSFGMWSNLGSDYLMYWII